MQQKKKKQQQLQWKLEHPLQFIDRQRCPKHSQLNCVHLCDPQDKLYLPPLPPPPPSLPMNSMHDLRILCSNHTITCSAKVIRGPERVI